MSQHDYTIADADGATFLADLNAMAAAIATTNAGAAAPSPTYAYQFWPDTANDLLKQRNAANSAWIDVCKLSTWAMVSVQKLLGVTATVGGTATAITATTSPATSGVKQLVLDIVTGNGGAATTLAANGDAPKGIKAYDATGALVDTTLLATQRCLFFDIGTYWLLVNALPFPSQQPGEICFFARSSPPSGFLRANGAAISRTVYAALFAAIYKSATATMTIASPSVITWNNHGLSANDPVRFTTTGTLPTGFVANTDYYVVGASITGSTFQLSATAGGVAINTSGIQSGVHTAISAPFGVGDGSTTFNLPDMRGEFVRGLDDGRGVDTGRSIGSAQADDLKSHSHTIVNLTSSGAYENSNTNGSNVTWSSKQTGATGGGETRPRNVAFLACIKY